MNLEKVIVRTSGVSMLLGALAWTAGRLTDTSWLGRAAPYMFGFGVVIAFLPLTALVVYSAAAYFSRAWAKRHR